MNTPKKTEQVQNLVHTCMSICETGQDDQHDTCAIQYIQIHYKNYTTIIKESPVKCYSPINENLNNHLSVNKFKVKPC